MAMSGPPAVAQRGLITVSIMLATIMQALDTTIANVALPHMQGSLSAAQDQITWVLTSYIVAAAIMTPLTGWLAGRYGRKRVFLVSVAGFTLASALCGMADSLTQIVLYRLLQGICGAALVPLSQAVLLDINPPARHGQAMAIWGAGIMVGPILGPTLGGWLTDDYSWRWVFYINLPVGLLAFFGILAFVTETRHDKPGAFDFFGFAMLSLGLGGLQLMLDRGELKDWFGSTEIWIEATVAALGFYLFIVQMATAKRPFVSRALFKDRNFATGTIFIFIVGMILYATMALLPPMLQDLFNYPVITSGIVTVPRGIGTMIAMIMVGRLVGRVDVRLIILVGFGLTAFSLWQMTGFTLMMGETPFLVSGVIQGFGLGFLFVPLTTIAFGTLAPALRTEGAAIFSLLRNVGSSVGISIIQALLTENTQIAHASLAAHVTPYNPLMHSPLMPQGADHATHGALAALNGQITAQASMIAYLDDYWLMMILALAAIPLLLVFRTSRGRGAAPAIAVD
jgi:MFS transporter, DHA2 family, multidrug resistance protein